MTDNYYSFSRYLRDRFGTRVYKIALDLGLTCPNRDGSRGQGGCIYCRNESFVPASARENEDLQSQLESGREFLESRYGAELYIAYFQSYTSTYAPVDYLDKVWGEAVSYPGVVGLAVSTRPDCVPDEVLDLLSKYSQDYELWLELGLQSAHSTTLDYINRGHTVEDFEDAVRRAHSRSLKVCAHVILGLPRETQDDMLETARFLARLDVEGVKFHHLHVLKGTRLAELYRAGEIDLLSLSDYSRILGRCLEYLPEETVIHRLFGDAPRDQLLAPRWSLDKNHALASIRRSLKIHGISQGSRSNQV